MQFIPTSLFVIGAVTILFLRNHTLGLALGAWTVFFVIFQIYVAKKQQPIRAASSAEDSRMTGALADAISNQNTISLFAGNRFEQVRFPKQYSAGSKLSRNHGFPTKSFGKPWACLW